MELIILNWIVKETCFFILKLLLSQKLLLLVGLSLITTEKINQKIYKTFKYNETVILPINIVERTILTV